MTERQKMLWDVLKANKGIWLPSTKVYEAVNATSLFDDYYECKAEVAYKQINADMIEINESGEVPGIIISDRSKGYKIAETKEEFFHWCKTYMGEASKKFKYAKPLAQKAGMDGQQMLDLFGEGITELDVFGRQN